MTEPRRLIELPDNLDELSEDELDALAEDIYRQLISDDEA